MFVDASVLCAILLREADGPEFRSKLETAANARTSYMAAFETIRAVLRSASLNYSEAKEAVFDLLAELRLVLISVGPAEGAAALAALDRFGKGRHKAQLNMGDCFAYGCARANGLPLLFKGDDFIHTDIERA